MPAKKQAATSSDVTVVEPAIDVTSLVLLAAALKTRDEVHGLVAQLEQAEQKILHENFSTTSVEDRRNATKARIAAQAKLSECHVAIAKFVNNDVDMANLGRFLAAKL